ncbi:PTS sugar transporter subunit IIB [Aerococcus urinae]|uniref:PTS sugar transporter subunit IIB n=1 Tax=Aerococcus urinae TaxID=1376 RepID=UPI00255050D9|nr:PTS sugar transporter subunit IIB [Aerococcus urinae]MDK6371127.1 PTS sugar transporter subunit IIB [Aerococcus urinae]
MKTIMLVCNAGMSTSLLVTKMQKAAEKLDQNFDIFAIPLSEVEENVANKEIDVLLVGPQVKFMKNEYEKAYGDKIKVDSINMQDYGTMNGEKVLNAAIELMEK